MNRRGFFKIIAAASAAQYAGAPPVKAAPGPVRLEYGGFTFIEDPNPLRFILTPVASGAFELVEYKEPTEPKTVRLNPAWVAAERAQFFFHPDAFRRMHAEFKLQDPVKPEPSI